jgi:hypothetical protein
VRDGSNETFEPAIIATEFENLFDNGAILSFQFVRFGGRRDDIGTLFDTHAEPAIRVRLRRAGYAAMKALQ